MLPGADFDKGAHFANMLIILMAKATPAGPPKNRKKEKKGKTLIEYLTQEVILVDPAKDWCYYSVGDTEECDRDL